MNDTANKLKLRLNESELEVIKDVTDNSSTFYSSQKINDKEYILSFSNIDMIIAVDEMIKDKLIYKGFDINYNLTKFGEICENLIDKFYPLIK